MMDGVGGAERVFRVRVRRKLFLQIFLTKFFHHGPIDWYKRTNKKLVVK
jgi:hypothetical protein